MRHKIGFLQGHNHSVYIPNKPTTHSQLTRLVRLLIVSCLAMAFSLSAGFAQEVVPYNFSSKPMFNSTGTSLGDVNKQISAASNGYGNWTVNANGNWFLLSNELNNEVFTGNIIPSGIIATGALGDPISNNFPTEIKVAANLHGSVRYVYPDNSNNRARGQFIVQGFDPSDLNISFSGLPTGNSKAVVRTSPINTYPPVSVGQNSIFDATPTPISLNQAPELSWRDCYDIACDAKYLYFTWEWYDGNGSYHVFATAQDLGTGIPANGFPMQIDNVAGGPGKGRRPTISCDVRNNTSPVLTISLTNQGMNYTSVPAVIISGGGGYGATATATVSGGVVTGITLTSPGSGYISAPIVTITGGGGTGATATTTINSLLPTFDIAFIDIICNSPSTQIPDNPAGHVWHCFVNSGAAPILTQQPKSMLQSNSTPHTPVPYLMPMHVRMVTSSVESGTIPVKGIYAIVYDGDFSQNVGHLIFHSIFNQTNPQPPNSGSEPNAPYAFYVDGTVNQTHEQPLGNGQHHVLNNPLQAFANPYDGLPQNAYDEFHCLYLLNGVSSTQFPLVNTALLIVCGNHNSIFGVGTGPSPRIINRQFTTSWIWNDGEINTNYITSSVNQMGIHAYWNGLITGGSQPQFYSRDTRSFDEDIEENTLVSGACLIRDGSSSGTNNHGGTAGAMLLPGRTMSIWTDPNFGVDPNSSSSGLYIPGGLPAHWHNGRLSFADDNINLQIGDPSAHSSSGVVVGSSTLIDLPNFEIIFTDLSTDHHQQLIINPFSSFEYNGAPPNGSVSTYKANFIGAGAITLAGSALNVGGRLNIHAGAECRIPDFCKLIGTNSAVINFPHENTIVPGYTQDPNVNPIGDGTLKIHGTLSLNNCGLYGHTLHPSYQATPGPTDLIWARPQLYSSSSNLPSNQFTLTNCYGQGGDIIVGGINDPLPWQSRIHFDGSSGTYRNSTITGCGLIGWEIYADGLQNYFEISNSTFTKGYGNIIDLSTPTTNLTYGNILISGNSIYGVALFGDQVNGHGISLTDFGTRRTSTFDKIIIQNNTVSQACCSGVTTGYALQPYFGINLVNSSAKITGNTIQGGGYVYGISNTGFDQNNKSNSLICSNSITDCGDEYQNCTGCATIRDGGGIFTQYWDGEAKMNEVSGCENGHLSNDYDDARILFSRYNNNAGTGLWLAASTSRIDLSGIHNTIPTDIAAFDTIDHNNSSQSAAYAQIQLTPTSYSDGKPLVLGTANTSTTTYGRNSIISNSTTDNLVLCVIVPPSVSVPIAKINNNYWATGTGAGTSYTLSITGTDLLFPGVGVPTTSEQGNAPFLDANTEQCGDGLDPHNSSVMHNEGNKLQSIEVDTISDTSCFAITEYAHRLWEDGIPSSYKKGNDTLRYFIENCGYKHSIPGYGSPGNAFDELASDVQGMDTSNGRWLDFSAWLKKVLYYNLDTQYYCGDAGAMLSISDYIDPVRGKDYNGEIAILDYLINNNRCPFETASFWAERKSIRSLEVRIWRDSVGGDSANRPIDTSAVTIDKIGFSILRGQSGVVTNKNDIHGLDNLTASTNPFTDQTTLETTIGDAMMLRLEIFDLLGRQLYAENRFFSVGDMQWTLDGKNFPEGTFYARVSTNRGNVKTIKLVRQ
jgi:hypothetical protein